MTNSRNRDSLIGSLTQSSQDLHFKQPLCGYEGNYYIMVYLAHIPAVCSCTVQSSAGNTNACYVNRSFITLFVLQRNVLVQHESLEQLESGLNVPEHEGIFTAVS